MLDRRTLLKYLGLASAGATVSCAGLAGAASRPDRFAATTDDSDRLLQVLRVAGPQGGRILVAVRLEGGNDGLDTVIPSGNPAYERTRQRLALRHDQLLPLDADFALHPSLPGFAALWRAGHLAIVHGLHHMASDLSHFRSADLWSRCAREETTRSGWLGRVLDVYAARDGNPLWGVAVGNAVPAVMAGDQLLPAAVPVSASGLLWDQAERAESPELLAGLALSSASADEPGSDAGLVVAGQRLAVSTTETTAPYLAAEADDSLAAQLQLVARLIRAGLGTRVYHVIHPGDFDVHSDQRARQAILLSELDRAVTTFLRDLGEDAGRVVVMTWSEFGRRPKPNGSGTDHGTASVLFVAGAGIKGGHYGEPASLSDLDDDGNLRPTTDCRAVAATLAERWLGIEGERVVPGVRERISLIA